ncbi:hypothetical protein K1T71_009989 [Dendrolimus kikuchii]|uniref:Uncharacterized protein n=1 Tax=Dendrolimus kikuchii TaxID=765133 RepID=A0ACC1CTF7_9NEOP|nr:hypothetical protein K1T71_009989 [Dendrolimus kikuchii]
MFYIVVVEFIDSVNWDRIRCSVDTEQKMPEGTEPNIGRFPWLGIVQHSFYIGGKTRFAITGGVLIHPAYAIAPAEDMAKIVSDNIVNNTKFVVWQSAETKYAIDVLDYLLHPQYNEDITYATIALLELASIGVTGVGETDLPVLPVCMPVKAYGSFSDLYVVRMFDEHQELEKEVRRMKYVTEDECNDFYHKNKLAFKKMAPVLPICAVSEILEEPCVWDGGYVLIARQTWGHWKLIGFGLRGPGCGAPARFLNIHDYVPWLSDIIDMVPISTRDEMHSLVLRRLSPIKMILTKNIRYSRPKSKELGQCKKGERGGVLFRENSEIVCGKNFAQGFYNVVITQVAQFSCAIVDLEVTQRTNAAMWLEHNCHRDRQAMDLGHMPVERKEESGWGPIFGDAKTECFIYFKTTAFLQFRFVFSFKAMITATIYGTLDLPARIPNPHISTMTTDAWWPTKKIIKWGAWTPYYKWWYWL